jgi:hypothetical protein
VPEGAVVLTLVPEAAVVLTLAPEGVSRVSGFAVRVAENRPLATLPAPNGDSVGSGT